MYFFILIDSFIHLHISDVVVSGKVRHAFTQKCFETLLEFSFVNGESSGDNSTSHSAAADSTRTAAAGGGESAPVSQMAVRTLLTRCSTIINKYNSDVELTRNVPPPRYVCITHRLLITNCISKFIRFFSDEPQISLPAKLGHLNHFCLM